MDKEVYYYIESSHLGTDDWFRHTNGTYDTKASALEHLCKITAEDERSADWEFRIVRTTVTTEVVA